MLQPIMDYWAGWWASVAPVLVWLVGAMAGFWVSVKTVRLLRDNLGR